MISSRAGSRSPSPPVFYFLAVPEPAGRGPKTAASGVRLTAVKSAACRESSPAVEPAFRTGVQSAVKRSIVAHTRIADTRPREWAYVWVINTYVITGRGKTCQP